MNIRRCPKFSWFTMVSLGQGLARCLENLVCLNLLGHVYINNWHGEFSLSAAHSTIYPAGKVQNPQGHCRYETAAIQREL